MDILFRISAALDRFEADGRRPARLLLGHTESAEVEAILYRSARTWYGLLGDVIAEDAEYAPKLPYPLTAPVTVFGVPVDRVDQPALLGVIGELMPLLVNLPCCSPCPYRPERVAWLLRRIDELAQLGYAPCEAIASVLSDPETHGSGFGPGMKRGLDDVADIARAIKAGHSSPDAIACFLCPFAAGA